VHPNDAPGWTQELYNDLRELACQPKVVAIGEIGLDYYWERTPVALQRLILERQLSLAAELSLPVVLHVRDKSPDTMPAMRDMLALLKDWTAGLASRNLDLAHRPGVLHSFSGDLPIALEAARMNFLIGVAGPVTYKNAQRLREVVANVADHLLLVETDAPFLTPNPHRGERNEPALVRLMAEKIAHVRQTSFEMIMQITSLNAKRLFLW